LYTDEMISKAV